MLENKNGMELESAYLAKVASQLIVISSLLSGFSIAVLANLLVTQSEDKILDIILKITTIAAACFLINLFSMTQVLLMSTEGYPIKVELNDLNLPKMLGVISFVLGIVALCILIALSGWTKSKSTGIFTTIVGGLTLIILLLSM